MKDFIVSISLVFFVGFFISMPLWNLNLIEILRPIGNPYIAVFIWLIISFPLGVVFWFGFWYLLGGFWDFFTNIIGKR